MTIPSIKLLVDALNDPAALLNLDMQQWDLLIRQGRTANMLARIAAGCDTGGLMERIPQQPRRHLESAANLALRQHRELRWEVRLIEDALSGTGVPLVLLKGAAYAMSGLSAARGRMMSDVDILVPRESLPTVESALMKRGWISVAHTAYDQRYYRTWMQELPPMRHVHRGSVIDVHHAILPLSSRSHPSTAAILAAARPVQPGTAIQVLAPVDMVLHSATHLFHEGEFEQGFRGVVDLDALLREFAVLDGFWRNLVPRAIELEVVQPLFYALRYATLMLATPVPPPVLRQSQEASGSSDRSFATACMDAMFLRALRPAHTSMSDSWTPLARWLLYVRSHWLRMPPWLLAMHLGRKMLMPKKTAEAKAA